jgi:hypothetical protein
VGVGVPAGGIVSDDASVDEIGQQLFGKKGLPSER